MQTIKKVLFTILSIFLNLSFGIENAKRLYTDIGIIADESKFWRPVKEDQSSIFVYLGVTFIQIMNVDEKKKILTMSVQLRQIWKNKYLSWNPENYGNIKSIYLPHNKMWLPDIVLFNNADGKYETQFPNKPTLYYTGLIDWKSPAIFQSTCEIDVRYFPYDEQICYLNFGSWTYNKEQVKLRHIKQLEVLLSQKNFQPGSAEWKQTVNYSKLQRISDGAFLTNYHKSGEWDLMETPAILSGADDFDIQYDYIRFGVKIRRKIMFYNINLIFPMVGLSIMAALSFYLPVKSGEKIDLSTLILFAIAVFFVLLGESVPPSSLVTPIINQYLIITFLLISLSVMSTVFVLNFHFRSNLTDEFTPRFMRTFLLKFLPKILVLKPPPKFKYVKDLKKEFLKHRKRAESIRNSISSDSTTQFLRKNMDKCIDLFIHCERKSPKRAASYQSSIVSDLGGIEEISNSFESQIKEACCIISEITEEILTEIELNNIENEYMLAAIVLDRLILYVFCFLSLLVVLLTFLQCPTLFDKSPPMNEFYFNDSKLNRLLLQQL